MQVYSNRRLLMWVESNHYRSFNSTLHYSKFRNLGYTYGNTDLKLMDKLLFQ